MPLLVLCGLGFGLFQTPNNRTLFLAASPERSGAAGGMQGTARLSGQTAGAVLVTLLFATTSVPITLPAPGLLSSRKDCPRDSFSFFAYSRSSVSVGPPAATGMTMVTGFDG